VKLVFFDENVIRTSPAGSCVLTALEELSQLHEVDVVCNRLDCSALPAVHKIAVPLPNGPVLARSVLFSVFAYCMFTVRRGGYALRVSTQGVFPFCDVSYAHCCHRLFLSCYRSQIGGGMLRRTARILNHAWGAWTEAIGFRHAKIILVPSEGLKRELVRGYGNWIAQKIRVLPNPVDTERFRRPGKFSAMNVRRELDVETDAVVFSFCALGNFEWKGLRLILEALSRIEDSRANLLVIGGGASEIAEYWALATKLGIEAQVRFVGLQADIRRFLWCSDAFVFPSAHETFPLVCLQAAAAGLPLITTPLYGVEEFAKDGETGWIVRRDAASLADTLKGALHRRLDLAEMGENARRRVLAYDVERFQARWRDLMAGMQTGAD
jgi:glycosyltransferase involved in cell wall biosynthesis